jgi:hypothetical protein
MCSCPQESSGCCLPGTEERQAGEAVDGEKGRGGDWHFDPLVDSAGGAWASSFRQGMAFRPEGHRAIATFRAWPGRTIGGCVGFFDVSPQADDRRRGQTGCTSGAPACARAHAPDRWVQRRLSLAAESGSRSRESASECFQPGFPRWHGVRPAPCTNVGCEGKILRWIRRPSPDGRDG